MTKLTKNEISEVSLEWMHMSDTSYLESFFNSRYLIPYFEELKNHEVIEIGPGDNPINKHFPCKEYSEAHGYPPHDGLSVLREKKDASVVVVSFGVIDDCILMPKHRNSELLLKYVEELVNEIKRVTNPFSIIVGNSAQKYMGNPDIPTSSDWLKSGGVYLRK